MTGLLQLDGKVAHNRETGDNFLSVMQYIVDFLTQLHQHIDHIVLTAL